MKVRDWRDILQDVVDSGADPAGWRAVGGRRARGIGEDLFVGHPAVGVFQLKTYAKNPFEVQGIGARVARNIDDELDPLFPREDVAGFGIQPVPSDEEEARTISSRIQTVVGAHADAPTTPTALFEDLMDALESPAYGPMAFDGRGRPEPLDDLSDTFEDAESLLDAEFEDVIDEDVERGFY